MKHSASVTVNSHFLIALLCMAVASGCSRSADSSNVTIERSRLLMDRNQTAEAVALLDEVLAATPNHVEARFQRGVACEKLGVLDKALLDYTECLKIDGGRADALNNKAVVLAKMKRFDEAAVEFGRLIDLNPQEALSHRNRGLCQVDLGNYDAALPDYAKALELAPTDPAGWFQRGNVYLKQGRLAEAEQDYSKAIELDPELAKAWMNRGVVRYKRGDRKLAEEDLKKSQSLDDNIVIPDIGFFGEGSPVESPANALTDPLWPGVRALAEKELTTRGFTGLTLAREYPSVLCAEYFGELKGKRWTVVVTCGREGQDYLTLPSKAQPDATENCALLVLHISDAPDSLPFVSRFEDHWVPLSSSGLSATFSPLPGDSPAFK